MWGGGAGKKNLEGTLPSFLPDTTMKPCRPLGGAHGPAAAALRPCWGSGLRQRGRLADSMIGGALHLHQPKSYQCGRSAVSRDSLYALVLYLGFRSYRWD